ncbi:flagellar protein FlgN [Halalkalibacterium halodurans]|uniref:flagellar protein FlgN n=1 Tax=Halalkalibacterium halodurans TaxID=86665 RepID=UPI0010674CB2|nr:flagellar protein FlgN [Halalkalibacterium halodurans]MDY7224098.1 flagellar protein FlgN [Halalkalibacterium halodurans]MDY7243383.1 flagellar protein FlgN [Halalkalibacterium halodurans]TES54709.1 flagellar protein FlgN [Halalkalibacterium halodurans]
MSAKQVIGSLTELLHIHEELLTCAKEKAAAIKNNDMVSLEKLVRAETALIHKGQVQEKIRSKEVAAFFDRCGQAPDELTVRAMLPHVTKEEQAELEGTQSALIETIMALQVENERNQLLIQESLSFVNMSLDLLLPSAEHTSYQPPQQKERHGYEEGYSTFDSKA